jgi:hypothetical protein
MSDANDSFDANKITNKIEEAKGDEISRFEALAIYLSDGIRNAVEKHNANEAKMGCPPASHYEISVSLAWAVCWIFGDEMDRIITDLLYMRNCDGKLVERTEEKGRKEAEESLLRLVGRHRLPELFVRASNPTGEPR